MSKSAGSRSDLRRKLRAARCALTSEQQVQAGNDLADIIISQLFLTETQHIALYLANDGEIDPAILISRLWGMGKQCYLPVIELGDERGLSFVLYQPETRLINNKYGIPEPEYKDELVINSQKLDLVFMPLTGFDEKGQRLGMGGGYYDRTFEFVRTSDKPLLVGLAHECQKVSEIPVKHWDIPMAGIATNKHYYTI